MNYWSQKTLDLVTAQNYLDKLQIIYPHEEGERQVDEEALESIKSSFIAKDNFQLLDKLLGLEKFPYKDSYVAFLRKDRTAIERNPQTVERICPYLYKMGLKGVLDGIKQSKEANMRRGPQFVNWVRSKFPVLELDEFKKSKQGVVVLGGNELSAKNFCNSEFNLAVSKRPDLVAKVNNKYVVGEAKFLSSTGGNQGTGFEDGIKLATNSSGTAYKIFVLDGIHWIEKGSAQHKRIESTQATILSVLLLNEFLDSLL